MIGPLHDATGVLGGFGYAALLALLAGRLSTPPPRGPVTWSAAVLRAVAATGQRSMTCYLVVWTAVFTPFLLDLAGPLGVASTALLAVLRWLLTVVLAVLVGVGGPG